MSIESLINALFAGACFYVGILHLMIGVRNQPRDTVNLAFAIVSLLFGIYGVNLYFLGNAIDGSSISHFVAIDKWGVLTNYLTYAALFWFIAVYTAAPDKIAIIIISIAYVTIALSNYVLPYTWIYTDIALSAGSDPVLTLSPWYKVEGATTPFVLLTYSGACISGQFRKGNRNAAWALVTAIGIFLFSYAWDVFLVEYGLVPFILLQQYGFIAFIVIMSLRLSGQVIEARKQVQQLNVELEHRVDEGTADLREANRALLIAKDAAQAANRAKSEFLTHMSHELRTPLNAILGNAQIMSRDASLQPRQSASIHAIGKSGDHLLTLINSVLEMSKIEAGQTVLTPSSFRIDSLITDIQTMFRGRMNQRGLSFNVEKSPLIPDVIEADRGKITQVLINLLDNAIRWTPKGAVSLRVGMTDKSGGSGCIAFEVQDTGVGIAAENQERIFDPFIQVSDASGRQSGTGLGLAISRQFAQLMGGDLELSSRVGQGSIFRLTIPVVETVSSGVVLDDAESQRIAGIAGQKPDWRILVVDDDALNRNVLEKMLTPIGFTVRQASGGMEAIGACATWLPHLVLMDIRMPEVDGIAAIQAIRATDTGRTTPIIGVSASVFEADRATVLNSGADDFVAKPVQETELLEKIGRCLNIDYRFDCTASNSPANLPNLPELGRKHLAELPENLLAEMRAAFEGGYMERLDELAREAERHSPIVSRRLLELVQRYDFESLANMLVENGNNAGPGDHEHGN